MDVVLGFNYLSHYRYLIDLELRERRELPHVPVTGTRVDLPQFLQYRGRGEDTDDGQKFGESFSSDRLLDLIWISPS